MLKCTKQHSILPNCTKLYKNIPNLTKKGVSFMLNHLKVQSNTTVTENGAITHVSTNSHCLDLFATIGALRRESDKKIQSRFMQAFTENKDIAMKLLFFARDIRGGLGERRVFRVILRWLANNEAESLRKNLAYVAEYGRFDDLLVLFGTPCEADMLKLVKAQFQQDTIALAKGESVSLMAKWLPSVNASNGQTVSYAKAIAKYLGLNDASYRKAVVALRANIKIIENNLRTKDYTFDYSKQPSKAMYKYRMAFVRNDGKRYQEFIKQVNQGKAKLNANTLAPYELVEPFLSWEGANSYMRRISQQQKDILNATWANLPDFSSEENALAVVDTSGSMYCASKPMPGAVALSLGLYLAEHNTGHFANHFIEFSRRPKLIEIKGKTFADRLRYVASFSEVANTNLQAVFDLILQTAVKNDLPQSDLPSKLIIISDMEFDQCMDNAGVTNFQNAKAKFQAKGYKLPDVVFWNVASRNRQQPVTANEQGAMLVSGCTPRLFTMIASGTTNPYTFMLEVIESERYAKICA